MKVVWKMIEYGKLWNGIAEYYSLTVKPFGLGWYWCIVKDAVIVDECFYHSPTNNELSARAQAERCLNQLITK